MIENPLYYAALQATKAAAVSAAPTKVAAAPKASQTSPSDYLTTSPFTPPLVGIVGPLFAI